MRLRLIVVAGAVVVAVLLITLLLIPFYLVNTVSIDARDFSIGSFIITEYAEAEIIEPVRLSMPCADIPVIKTNISYKYVEILPGLRVRMPILDVRVTNSSGGKCEVEIPGLTMKIPKKANVSVILRIVVSGNLKLFLERADINMYINNKYVGNSSVGGGVLYPGTNFIEVPVVVELEEAIEALVPTMIKYAVETAAGQAPTITINIFLKILMQMRPEALPGIPALFTIERIYEMERNMTIPITI